MVPFDIRSSMAFGRKTRFPCDAFFKADVKAYLKLVFEMTNLFDFDVYRGSNIFAIKFIVKLKNQINDMYI